MSIKNLVGKKLTKKVEFMGDEVEVRKLSVAEIMQVQELVRKAQKAKGDDAQLGLLKDVIRVAVVGAEELSDEDFDTFPLSELNNLTNAALEYSGLTNPEAGN